MKTLKDKPAGSEVGADAVPTPEQVQALAEAMQQVLDDMGIAGRSVCGATKAQARVAYEPFMAMLEDEPEFYMPLEEAEAVLRSVAYG